MDAIREWTALQERHFYEDNPLIYFYLAGELPQDEIGAQAGILARRPKIAFNQVLAYDDDTFAAWRADDLDTLHSMLDEYGAVFDTLPEPGDGDGLGAELYAELYDTLWVYVQRISHAVALYEGVVDARAGDRDAAEAHLADAEAITAAVIAVLQAAEQRYRYPIELLARSKPESLTAYPYGYLEQTSTGFFWTRRDDQLASLIVRVFDGGSESWQSEPEQVYWTDSDTTTLTEPDDPLAAQTLGGFIPRSLFGLRDIELEAGTLTLSVAIDSDGSDLPDPDSEVVVPGVISDRLWTASGAIHPIAVFDATGERLGTLTILQPRYTLALEVDSDAVTSAGPATITGEFEVDSLVSIVLDIEGADQELVDALLKGIYDIPANEPLPDTLPVAFEFALERLE